MHKFSWIIFRNKKTTHQEEVALLKASGLFDEQWYKTQNPHVNQAGVDPVSHYLTTGAISGLDPSPSFSNISYIRANPDVGVAKVNPLLHYVKHGIVEGRTNHQDSLQTPLGRQSSVNMQGADDSTLSNIVQSNINMLRKALAAKSKELGSARGNIEISEAEYIAKSGLFDEEFYLRTYPQVTDSSESPIDHFIRIGWRNGFKPNPDFDTAFYIRHYKDIARLEINPLIHYLDYGIYEGRETHPSGSGLRTDVGETYKDWVEAFDTLTNADIRSMKARTLRFRLRPLISIIMPVYNTQIEFLAAAVNSIKNQTYANWELCVADDASTDPRIRELLSELSSQDPRIKVIFREKNGNISAASNSALGMATGEFSALMDHDDLLPSNALFEVIACINQHHDVNLVYSDEDRIDRNGLRCSPYFKTAFNKELLLSQNTINHLAVYRTSVIRQIDGFRIGFEGSQDYDLALRVIDCIPISTIIHIPSILYHWRMGSDQSTFSEGFVDKCILSAQKALGDHLARNGEVGTVRSHPYVKTWHRVMRQLPSDEPLVSIIVPTKDQAGVLEICCKGVLDRTSYRNIELIIVNHDSVEPDTYELFEKISTDRRVKILSAKGAFNYSRLNNDAILVSKGSLICLLNNDIEVIDSDWLSHMVAHAVLPDVGAVGAKLLYPDGRTQHGGVILGVGGVAGHRFHLLQDEDLGPSGLASLAADISAVTAACLVMRRNVFDEVGGLDEDNLPVAFNDIDLCLKVSNAGYRVIYNPQATLYHHESLSRGDDLTGAKKERFMKEVEFMIEKWGEYLLRDKYYNPNLDLSSADYSLSWPPRIVKSWTKSELI